MLHLPLHRQFRFIHEPLPLGDTSIPVLGHEDLVVELQQRLAHSHGGAFLVTGFRGVGKTTLVMRALEQASAATARAAGRDGRQHRTGHPGPPDFDVLLVVHLSLAREMTVDQLLFAVVRRIFESLEDRGLFARLPRDVQDALLLAYSRTSLSFTQSHAEGSERGATLGLDLAKGPLAAMSPALNLTGRRTSSRMTEASYLAYSETDVEHDLVRIIHLLNGRQPLRPGRRRLRRRKRPLRVHPVVVLDEADKLTDSTREALENLEALLRSLKGVLTTRGAHFILVAGPDLHDRALMDADRGSGLYESVFAWRMYVPCQWPAPERLVRELAARGRTELGLLPYSGAPGPSPHAGDPPGDHLRMSALVAHLRFKSRGVLRRLLQEFNSFVTWDDSGRPAVRIGADDWQRVRFYSDLDRIVGEPGADGPDRALVPVAIDEDRWRLGGYHVADWALRSRGRVFAASDVSGDGQVDPLVRLDAPSAERWLRRLVRGGVVEVVSEPGRPDATLYGNAADAAVAYFRLSDEYARRLSGFARSNENERADLGMTGDPAGTRDTSAGGPPGGPEPQSSPDLQSSPGPPPFSGPPGPTGPVPAGDSSPPPAADDTTRLPAAGPDVGSGPPSPPQTSPVTRLADRYEVRNLIGSGGMGAVYRGRDLLTGEDVAIKLIHRGMAGEPEVMARFRREAEIGMRMRHAGVARTIGLVEAPEAGMIMELIDGTPLQRTLLEAGPLPAAEAVRMGRGLGEALRYLHDRDIARIDLKPSNVIVHPTRGPVVVDLGIARHTGAATRLTLTGTTVGTPAYMAPEQIEGDTSVDIRSDLYSLGAMLYQCLSGHLPHAAGDQFAMMYAALHEPISYEELPVSAPLRAVLRRCLEREPGDRYPTPAAFLEALAATPEAQDG